MTFYEIGDIEDAQLRYAVIAARYKGKWILCKNKTRKWELPGGHREEGESILDTAKRELLEETGALTFELKPVCVYHINSFGLLFYAEVTHLGDLPQSEIEAIDFFDELPEELSFPFYHPKHLSRVKEALGLD